MTAKSAIFVDFDNVFSTLWDLDKEAAERFASEPGDWLQSLTSAHLNDAPPSVGSSPAAISTPTAT